MNWGGCLELWTLTHWEHTQTSVLRVPKTGCFRDDRGVEASVRYPKPNAIKAKTVEEEAMIGPFTFAWDPRDVGTESTQISIKSLEDILNLLEWFFLEGGQDRACHCLLMYSLESLLANKRLCTQHSPDVSPVNQFRVLQVPSNFPIYLGLLCVPRSSEVCIISVLLAKTASAFPGSGFLARG